MWRQSTLLITAGAFGLNLCVIVLIVYCFLGEIYLTKLKKLMILVMLFMWHDEALENYAKLNYSM